MNRLLGNLRIAHKLAAAFASVILAAGMAGVVAWLRLGDIQQATYWNAHTYEVLDRADRHALPGGRDGEPGDRPAGHPS